MSCSSVYVPQNSYDEVQTLQVVVGGNFGRDFDLVGGAPKSRSNALVKELSQNNLVTLIIRVANEKSASQQMAFTRTWSLEPAGTPARHGLPASGTV